MTYRAFWQALSAVYPEEEARWIVRLVMETKYHLTQADLLMGREEQLADGELRALCRRLLSGEPVQYVLGETVFCGRRFLVRRGVLIPRPETEELCRWVTSEAASGRCPSAAAPISVLDIGTGSGCIACTLAAELPQAAVTAWDISPEALATAAENARRIGVRVTFQAVDILAPGLTPPVPSFDLIVSNPPYVCEHEKAQMSPHVVDFEPSLALFVPDADPLLFHRAIARFAAQALTPGGRLFFELNAAHAPAAADMLTRLGYSRVTLRADQFGKQRFISACLPQPL